MMASLKSVFVVDDDLMFTFLLKKQCQSLDFCEQLIIFHNGLEALEALNAIDDQNALPGLILLDLNMPVMDGWQFLDAIAAYPALSDLKICIVSSSIDPADHERAKHYHIRKFYVKPFSKENLDEIRLQLT